MLDFTEGHIPAWYKFLYLLLYLLVWLIGNARVANLTRIRRSNVKVFLAFFTLFSVYYCLGSDYFQYEEWVKLKYDRDIWFKEQVYLYIIRFVREISVEYAYDLFRLIVWGGALFLVKLCVGNNERESYLTVLFLFLLFFNLFSYARASFAMAIYFYGVCLLSFDKFFYKIFGATIVVISVLFHTEMLIAVSITPILMFSLEEKKTLLYSLLFLAVAAVVLNNLGSLLTFYDEMSLDENSVSEKADTMNELVSSGRWSTQSIGQYIGYLLFYIPFCAIIRIIFKNKNNVFPLRIIYLYRITFAIIMVSAIFAIVFGFGTVFYYRPLYITIIPMSLLLAYFYNQGYVSIKFVKSLLVLAAFYQVTKLVLRLSES